MNTAENYRNARNAYDAKKASALKALEEIKTALEADQFENAECWANAGSMEHYNRQLSQLSDEINGTGEFAS